MIAREKKRAAAGQMPERRVPRGGETNTMRKNFALVMVAMLSLTIALAAVSCGKKKEATETTPTPPAEQQSMSDSSMMHPESTMTDTSMHH